jgi:acyl-CoA thioesterase
MIIDDYSKNYMGSMHGGLLYTMADVAAGASIIYCGKQAVTLNASTDYIKPACTGLIIAEGRVISKGKTICRCEVHVHDEDGTLYCKSHITMFITDKDIKY